MNKEITEFVIFLLLMIVSGWWLTFSTAVMLFYGLDPIGYIYYAAGWSLFLFSSFQVYGQIKRWLSD